VVEYFAYGSNMSRSVMDAVSPQHRFVGRAQLAGYRLAFTRRSVRTGTGVADIVVDPNATVWGVLYELGDGDLARLDRKEGAGWAYRRTEVDVCDDHGGSHRVVAYAVIAKAPREIETSVQYAQRLVAAARERALPAEYVDALRGRLARSKVHPT
jgi:gamma-glutamylcyclotransferase (GGCT)/AIG2-like uncharacterized protein YtfP